MRGDKERDHERMKNVNSRRETNTMMERERKEKESEK